MRLLFLALLVSPSAVFGASTIDVARPYAYSANAGWIHFRPSAADGVSIHDYHLAGKAYGANFGWIDFGDGTPGAGHIYSNAAVSDCGVNHDGAGNLQGYAYSANLGWIDFGWALASDPSRARFDLFTGQFHGYAYSANAGWILLGADLLATSSIVRADTDEDGIGDEWELAYFGDLTAAGATSDSDHDGASDLQEYLADTIATDPGDHPSLRIASISQVADSSVTTLEWPTRDTRLYTLETSTTLLPGSWSSLGDSVGTGFLFAYNHQTVVEPKRFYRLGSKLPLLP